MKYLSVCSGIEAASVAFKPLGWEPLAFSEIEAFPRAVLQHHYPDVPLHGDFTELKDQAFIEDADLLCGGTPCQAFSVAGLRKSLSDDRGNLTLQFILLADAIDHLRSTAGREPAWILYENVPGIFSTSDNAFGAFLGGLCGRDESIPQPADGWPSAGVVDGPTRVAAWRVMDAQHFGLAQRRKRVFVLARGGAGRWAVADALLPIIKGSEWHPAPSRGKGKGTARGFETGPSGGRITDLAPTIDCRAKNGPIQNQLGVGVIEVVPEVTRPLTAAMGTKWNGNGDLESSLIPSVVGTLATNTGPNGHDAGNFQCNQAVDAGHIIAHTLRGEGFDASEDGTGRGIPLVLAHGQANAEVVSDGSPSLTCNHEAPIVFDPSSQAPMLMRMREGKEGGGKGPLVSEDQSLTLATGNDQVLAYSPKIDTLQAKGIDHASTYEADASSALSTLRLQVGTEAYAQWGLGILGAFQSPEVLRAWLHGESLRQATDETRPRLVNGAPSREESASGEVLRKVWFDGPDGRTSQGRGLAKQLAGKPCEALSVLPHEGAPDETDMQVVRQAREGSRLLRQALSEIEAARRSEQVGVADQAEMHDAGMRPDEPRARAMQQARATTEEGNTGTATANQVTSGDGSLGPQMMVRRLLPVECEKLQGFPPNYTNIPWRGKPESPDGPRYKALGNSWAVPCAHYIGKRIQAVTP